MSIDIMCDNTQITISQRVNGKPQCKLIEGINRKYVPFELFRKSDTESTFDILRWACTRVFPQERTDCKELLEELNLERYDEWSIAKETRAALMTDYFWIKIEDTDTYEEYSLRGAAGIPPVNVFEK